MTKVEDIFDRIKKIIAEKQKEDIKLKFNIFSAISDVFYKENFHSDILFMFLQQESIYKNLFNTLEIKNIQDGSVKVFKEYPTFTAEKRGRVDIFIQYKDQDDKSHCIIIENKINDAVDQERQLWRYYDYCKNSMSMTVDKIIYLTLKDKEPDFGDCSVEERNEIENNLEKRTATEFVEIISKDAKNLNENTWSALIQYKNLIAYLNGDTTMNTNEKIYDIINGNKENYKILKDFYEVFDKFPEYIAKDVFKDLKTYKDKLFSGKFLNINRNKQYIYLDTGKINDNLADYGFRLELFFAHDFFFVQFRYYGYKIVDDKNLIENKNKTPLKFNECKDLKFEYPNSISVKVYRQINNPIEIKNIIFKDMIEFYKQVNKFVEDYIKEKEQILPSAS